MDEPNWKDIAMQLGQRVNFAISHLKADGAGVLADLNKPSDQWQHWRDYMADALEMIPGVTVDREMMHTFGLPLTKRRKAQAEIEKKREQTHNAAMSGEPKASPLDGTVMQED